MFTSDVTGRAVPFEEPGDIRGILCFFVDLILTLAIYLFSGRDLQGKPHQGGHSHLLIHPAYWLMVITVGAYAVRF